MYIVSVYKFIYNDVDVNLQEKASLEKLLKNINLREFREFCTSLLSNQIGGCRSNLCMTPNLSPQRQTLLELLVHLKSLLLSENPLLVPLHQIAFQPQNVTVRHFFSFCFCIMLSSFLKVHAADFAHKDEFICYEEYSSACKTVNYSIMSSVAQIYSRLPALQTGSEKF